MSQRQIRAFQVVLATAAVAGLAACGESAAGSGAGGLPTGTTATSAPAASSPAGTSSPSPSHRMTGTPVAPGPVTARGAARHALMHESGALSASLVRVGAGYEAATLAAGNEVVFWTGDGSTWTKDGTSTRLPTRSGDDDKVTVSGALLPGAKHATFVVKGGFTGDGTGQALAYGHGSAGWSLITAQPDGSLAPSGHGARKLGELGLELNMRFTEPGLTTYSLWGPSSTASFAMQRNRPTIRHWKASGSVLHLTGSNIVTTKRTDVRIPKPLPAPPGTSTLPDGTWAVRLLGISESDSTITMRVQPQKGHNCMAGAGVCFSPVGPSTPLKMANDAPTSVLAKDRNGQQQHITAPGWGFASVERSDQGLPLSSEYPPGSPWVVRASVAKTSIPNDYVLLQVKDGKVARADSIFGAAWHQK